MISLRSKKLFTLALCLFSPPALALANADDEISLAGAWRVSLQTPATAAWRDIQLPGTLDDAGIGAPHGKQPELTFPVLTRLQRKHSHTGPAWYQRDITIPESWRGKHIILELERVLWESRVFVDGVEISRDDSLSTPHRHDLSAALKPGARHELMLRIDNSELHPGLNRHRPSYGPAEDKPLAHAYTNHTQVIWNGALGALRLFALPPGQDALQTISVFPRVSPDFGIKIRVAGASCSRCREQDAPATLILIPKSGETRGKTEMVCKAS